MRRCAIDLNRLSVYEHPFMSACPFCFGSIVIDKLYEPPFDSASHMGIDGVFDSEDVSTLVVLLEPFLKMNV